MFVCSLMLKTAMSAPDDAGKLYRRRMAFVILLFFSLKMFDFVHCLWF